MDIVIFGISGHLAETKLVPALVNLYKEKKIPADTRLIGFSRSVKHFELPFEYAHVEGSYERAEDFARLKATLRPDSERLLYLALPPEASIQALHSIAEAKLDGIVLVEKPFGTSYADASSLISFVNGSFRPGRCLKVDHYAGKKELRGIDAETGIRKIIFEILETATVEGRGGFYDTVGALRDVGQNHLLFMLATFFKGEGKREDVLAKLLLDPDISKYLFGHYEGYDKIETFFSVPASLIDDNGVHDKYEITLRSGKGLSRNLARIWIGFEDGEEKEIVLSSGPAAYEAILLDALEGRMESFLSDQEVLHAWKFIEGVEKIKEKRPLFGYPVGSDEADFL